MRRKAPEYGKIGILEESKSRFAEPECQLKSRKIS